MRFGAAMNQQLLFYAKLFIALIFFVSAITGDRYNILIILTFCLPLLLSTLQLYLHAEWFVEGMFSRIINLNVFDLLLALLITGFSFSVYAAIVAVTIVSMREVQLFLDPMMAIISSSLYLIFSIAILFFSIYKKPRTLQ